MQVLYNKKYNLYVTLMCGDSLPEGYKCTDHDLVIYYLENHPKEQEAWINSKSGIYPNYYRILKLAEDEMKNKFKDLGVEF